MKSTIAVGLSAAALGTAGLVMAERRASAAPLNVCALVTPGQISAALGVAVDGGKPLGEKACQWREQAKPGAAAFIVDVNTNSPSFFLTMKSMAGRGTHKPAPGLGNDGFFAIWRSGNELNESLWVKNGNSAFNVRIWGSRPISDSEREAKERAIASAVLNG